MREFVSRADLSSILLNSKITADDRDYVRAQSSGYDKLQNGYWVLKSDRMNALMAQCGVESGRTR